MSIQEIAKHLDETFSVLFQNQRKAVADIEALFLRWDKELEPIKAVISKYRLYYKNLYVSGVTTHGIILGKKEKFPNSPLVLINGMIYPVDCTSDKLHRDEAMPLNNFIAVADLEIAKAGFDFVRELVSPDANPIAERNHHLLRFIEENSGATE